ncbi:MAG: LapA family protein [Hapalosiphonaceae cyanobacterium JJU2]|nr:MAG: LapA family protein [Hapalosiphonaceae cyanobacterium JJU2]
MALLRLILLVAIMGGLALLLAQNWSPILPLIFLGVQTKSLPLAMWILFSTAAGAATSLVISGLFQLSSYLALPQRSTSAASKSRRTTAKSDRSTREKSADSYSSYSSNTSPPPSATKTSSQSNPDDDWDTNNNEDWDFEEKSDSTSSQNTEVRDSKSYERRQEPTDSFRAGSSYSYSYREPKNSGVGKTESIYDADYRVIIPPYQPSSDDFTDKDNPTNQKNQADEEDWGFLEDIEDDQRQR